MTAAPELELGVSPAYPPLTGYCEPCGETVTTFGDGRCVWCDTPTTPPPVQAPRRKPSPALLDRRSNAKMTRRQVEAAYALYQRGHSMGEIAELIWQRFGYRTPTICASSLAHSFKIAGLAVRAATDGSRARNLKVTDDLVDEAWRRYSDGEMLPAIAEDLYGRGDTGHPAWERLYEGLIRQFRRRGYETRSRSENLKGRLCRTEKRCAATTNRGGECGANVIKRDDGSYGDFCWQHDDSYADRRDAIVHMEKMRAARTWMNELVPLQPLIEWATARAIELAPPPGTKTGCYGGRGGWAQLARRTGVAVSTWGKWRQGKSTKGEPKSTISKRKVREILERDGTATFAELYEPPEAIAA